MVVSAVSLSSHSANFILDHYLHSDHAPIHHPQLLAAVAVSPLPVPQPDCLANSTPISSSHPNPDIDNNLARNNRWSLRLSSLLNARDPALNSLGAQLALKTVKQNLDCLFSLGPRWLAASQTIIARNPTPPPRSLAPAIDLALYILDAGSRSPEFARENCDPKTISGMARALILASAPETDNLVIRSLGLRTLATLVDRNSSVLRPLGSQLQSLALGSLLAEHDGLSQAATALLSSLYRLSGKADASASWSRTVRATIGTIDVVLDALLSPFLRESGIYSEHGLARNQLAPLEIAAQELLYSLNSDSNSPETHTGPHRIPLLLCRVDRLTRVLLTMLSQPTERPVNVPIGELSTLSYRLLLVGKGDPSERADASWRSAWESVGGAATTRAIGCRLVAKLAECTASRFVPFATPTLSIIAAAIESGRDSSGHSSADLSVLYATYARLASSCPPSPVTIQQTLEPVLKAILADVERIYGRAQPRPGTQDQPAKKKTKKKTTQFESDQAWHTSPLTNPLDFVLAERALSTLERLLAAVPHFFPAPYLSIVVRSLLGLASHPSFTSPVSNLPGVSTVLSGLAPGPTSQSPHAAFAARPVLRVRILRCLLGCLPIQRTSAQPAGGLHVAQSLVGIVQKLAGCTDDGTGELARTAREGLLMISLLARPRVPPIFLTEAQMAVEAEDELTDELSEEECHDCTSYDTSQSSSPAPMPRPAPTEVVVPDKPSPLRASAPPPPPAPAVLPDLSTIPWERLRESGAQKRKSEDNQVGGSERPAKKRGEESLSESDEEGGFPKLVFDTDSDDERD